MLQSKYPLYINIKEIYLEIFTKLFLPLQLLLPNTKGLNNFEHFFKYSRFPIFLKEEPELQLKTLPPLRSIWMNPNNKLRKVMTAQTNKFFIYNLCQTSLPAI